MAKNQKKKRCCFEGCNVKLKLSDMPCRCKYIYCSKHRLPEQHNCSFNFKNESSQDFMQRVGLGGGAYKKIEVI